MREKLDGQYHKIALALAAGVRDGRLHSVVFTAPTRKQGTTSTLLNVARQLRTSLGIETLVVELNRTRPALERLFQLNEQKSVAAISTGKSALDCVQHAAGNLALIPIGDFTSFDSHTNATLSDAVARIEREVRSRYPLILWDAPPVLEQPVVMFLHNLVSNAVLVIESGRVNREVLERVEADFAAVGITLEGTIMVKQKRPIPGWIYRWLIH